jgi:hypothetical protein
MRRAPQGGVSRWTPPTRSSAGAGARTHQAATSSTRNAFCPGVLRLITALRCVELTFTHPQLRVPRDWVASRSRASCPDRKHGTRRVRSSTVIEGPAPAHSPLARATLA